MPSVDQSFVAEQRFAAEHREDLADDAEERECDDVDLGVAEEPEQVLPQDHAAVGRVEHVRPEPAVGQQSEQGGGEDREGDQDEDAGDQDVPGEDRHPEHGHARRAQAHHGGDHVDRAEDGAQAADEQSRDPQVRAHPG
jgi:hypothetical protein